jgi:hypothetical protein
MCLVKQVCVLLVKELIKGCVYRYNYSIWEQGRGSQRGQHIKNIIDVVNAYHIVVYLYGSLIYDFCCVNYFFSINFFISLHNPITKHAFVLVKFFKQICLLIIIDPHDTTFIIIYGFQQNSRIFHIERV